MLWPWKSSENRINEKIKGVEESCSDMNDALELRILSLENKVSESNESIKQEIIRLNNMTEILSDRYLSWMQQKEKIHESLKALNQSTEEIVRRSIKIPLRQRASRFFYRNQMVIVATILGVVSAAGLLLLFIENM